MKRICGILVGVMFFLAAPVFAQYSKGWTKDPAEGFDSTLLNLRDSVEKLGIANQRLEVRNKELAEEIETYKAKIASLEATSEKLSLELSKLEQSAVDTTDQRRAMEGEISVLNDQLDGLNHQIALKEKQVEQRKEEEARISSELSSLKTVEDYKATALPAADQDKELKKEKLKLLRMVADNQERQSKLEHTLLKLQEKGLGPAKRIAGLETERNELKKDLESLGADLDSTVPSEAPLAAVENYDRRIGEIEQEISDLSKQHAHLTKVVSDRLKTQGKAGYGDLLETQEKVALLKQDNMVLRQQIDLLQKQMVDLDKQKLLLETQYKQGSGI